MAIIYALCDPITEDVRYVGKAICLSARLKSHKNEKRDTRKCRWLESLWKQGLSPIVKELETVTNEKWEEAEIRWIAFYRELGCDLCNHTTGGEGLSNASEETRRKLSVIQKGRLSDPVYRAKIYTPERSAKISKSLTGKPKTPEHVRKLPQNQPKVKPLPEVKIRKSTKGRKISEGEKLSRSLSLKGKPKSESHKEKIRQGLLVAWARRKQMEIRM